jgi:hypothetical protein
MERFEDGDKVIGAKLLAYMKDLIKKIELLARSHPNAQKGPSLDILWRHFYAIQELYLDQCQENGILPTRRGSLRLDECKQLLSQYR